MAMRREGQAEVLQSVLARLAAEVGGLALQSRAIETRLATEESAPARVDLQTLDSLTQHLEATSTVLEALSSAVLGPDEVDQAWVARVAGDLRLQGLAGRLAGRTSEDSGPVGGEVELW
jgi:hypothetical protein